MSKQYTLASERADAPTGCAYVAPTFWNKRLFAPHWSRESVWTAETIINIMTAAADLMDRMEETHQ